MSASDTPPKANVESDKPAAQPKRLPWHAPELYTEDAQQTGKSFGTEVTTITS